jgi:hypothetical protein
MFLISAGNTLVPRPIFSGNVGLICSALLALIAGIQLFRGVGFLQRKEASLSVVLLLVFCIAQLVQFGRALAPPPNVGVDFSAYYLAAKVVSKTPTLSLYHIPLLADGRMNFGAAPVSAAWDAAALRYHVPFSVPYIYPPFCAVLMKPLAHLSFDSALVAWNMATTLLVAGAMFLALSLGGVRIHGKLALMLGVGLFSYYPLFYSLLLGQIGGLVLFLLAWGVWLLSRNRIWSSALCFALATLIKLTPVLAIPILIIHRRWKWLLSYVVWTISLLIFSVWQAGWIAHQQFWREVLPSISLGTPIDTNSSIVAFVQELFLGYVSTPLSTPLTLPLYAGALSRYVALLVYCLMLGRFYLRRRDGDLVRDLVIMVLLGIVISPISWPHHYMVGLLPFLYLWCKMPDKGRRMLLALFIAVATDIVGIVQFSVTNHIAQLILAAIIPCLTIAVAYLALAPGQEPSASRSMLEIEAAEIALRAS